MFVDVQDSKGHIGSCHVFYNIAYDFQESTLNTSKRSTASGRLQARVTVERLSGLRQRCMEKQQL